VSIPPFVALPEGVIRDTVALPDVAIATLQTSSSAPRSRVLMAPGFTGSKEDFIAVLPLLGQAQIHAVSYDHAGQFESYSSQDEERFGIERLATDMLALSRRIWPEGPRPHLVGHSLGGLVARRAVIAEPREFASVTLMASGPSRVPPEQHEALLLLRAVIPELDLASIWELKAARDQQLGLLPTDPTLVEFLQRRWVASNPQALAAKAAMLLDEPDLVEQLRATGTRAHVITGTNDDVWAPGVQQEMAARLSAEHSLIEGSGHAPATDDPQSTAGRLLAFWSSGD